MEKGEMRCDANVSVMPAGSTKFGTRAEIKNVNSFKNVKDAIEYEFRRQVELVESGGKVVQETRLWDAAAMRTESMRSKEEAHDYRYFPDPDLVPLKADPAWVAKLRGELPELPEARRARLAAAFGLSAYDAEVLVSDKSLSAFFDAAMRGKGKEFAKPLVNLITTELLGRLNKDGLAIGQSPVTPAMMASLTELVVSNTLSSKGAKDVFAKAYETREEPKALVEKLGLSQVSDEGQVLQWVKEALAANAQAAADLKAGKDAAAGRIVGAVMKLSKGKANPALVNKLIKEAVNS
jgi:aspartyl-tRNA(Asn)/glutamyl-tRNA(Gln) amidotransferase subunit B